MIVRVFTAHVHGNSILNIRPEPTVLREGVYDWNVAYKQYWSLFFKLLQQVHRDSDIWKYIGEVLLPQLYPIKWFNDINPKFQDDPDVRDFPGKLFLNDLNTKLLTGARIRQLRSTKGWLCFFKYYWEGGDRDLYSFPYKEN